MITRTELDQFHDFAATKLDDENVETLAVCVRLWMQEQDDADTVAAIRAAQAEVAAGRTIPVSQFEEEIREEFDLRPSESAQ